MATVITVTTSSLKSYLSDIDYLFPKGSKETPIGLVVSGTKLIISYTSGCIYKATVNCQNPSGDSAFSTVIYMPITSFLDGEETTLSFEPYGVIVHSGSFEFTLHKGFSVVNEIELPELHKIDLASSKIQSVRSLLKVSSSVVSGVEKPIIFKNSYAYSYYPNIIIMAKLDDVKLEGAFSLDNAKLLMRFSPESYALGEPGFIYLQRFNAYLKLPINDIDTNLSLSKILKKPLYSVNIYLDTLGETIRKLYKMCGDDVATLLFKDEGLDITLSNKSGNFKLSIGKPGTTVQTVRLPLNMLMIITDVMSSNMRITYYEGSILCFQTTTLTIVAHALR